MSSEVTILVIDDDKTTRETLVDIIQTMGHRAIAVGTGKEGDEKCELHNAHFNFNDDAIETGVMVLAELVRQFRA